MMIYSMTGYASATRELAAASGNGGVSVSVELRTVNSRFLDLNFRMPEDVRVCEPTLREMLMNKLSRGKVDIRINLQRSEQSRGRQRVSGSRPPADRRNPALAGCADRKQRVCRNAA
jgi:uncharacterized protein (TIGR00255 family)